MPKTTKEKQAVAASGLKKVTDAQAEAIKKLYDTNDERFQEVERIVHKSILFKITGDIKYAPKASRNERAEALNAILFS